MPVSSALLLAGALLALALAVGFALRMLEGRRRSGGDLRLRPEDLVAPLGSGATLVQFSTELCARCPQVRRLLSDVAASHPGMKHVEIDLTHRNDLAARYHVLQTPTSFLVDASGSVLFRWGGVPDRHAIDEAVASVLAFQTQEHR